ncbi:hypothetical protein [Jannaschia sp. R86511]|uniref:hypothetical protein n=1 Tax=Jannaschia sp. R86511 TaxID=3093853 RepID=UPI0036D3627A
MRRLLRLLPHHHVQPVGAPADPASQARYRADRRAVARRLHPDLGGDVESYLAALAEVDRRHGRTPDPGPTATGTTADRGTWRARRSGLRRRANRAARAARQHLPRRAPGARRYARL